MYDFLIDHALKNVWCAPRQDTQAIVRPARLTPIGGVWNSVKIMWRSITLPMAKTRFHVFQIGQLNPNLMGLFSKEQVWIKLSEACNVRNLIADVYNVNGVQLPRTETWYMVTEENNLVFAIKHQPLIPIEPDREDIFIRVYTNAYYRTAQASSDGGYIHVEGGTLLSQQALLDLQNSYDSHVAMRGHTYAFVNGYEVSKLDMFSAKVGDVAEFIYDSSIYKVVDFELPELPTFTSTLDQKNKFLLHYTGADSGEIDYHDDIDIFLCKRLDNGRHRGVYYHRNMADAMRMVTHRDYSITAPYVMGFVQAQSDWTDINRVIVRMQIRYGGWDRALVDENNRIKELYKLQEPALANAMLGVDSTVSNWRAEALEASQYAELMRHVNTQLDKEVVQSALGYNAISKAMANTPQHVELISNQRMAVLPYGLRTRSTAYEYDTDGKLLDWYLHLTGTNYPVRNYNAVLVEMLAAEAGDRPDEVYGETLVTLDPTATYRMYLCEYVNGVPNNQWVDVTGSGHYAVIDNELTWLIDTERYYPMVRSDRVMLAYTLSLKPTDGLLRFNLTQRALRNNVVSVWTMQIPMGELDIWLNGRALIEGVDYIVQFPQVVIFNKAYLDAPKTKSQKIQIRFSGFCHADLSRDIPTEVGFVDYGLLSRNNRFDIRDDKVMRVTVGGALYAKDELQFSETDSGVMVPDASNGLPYLIRDIVVPMRGHTTRDTYELRAASQIIDRRISDYMTLKLPQPKFSTPSAIQQKYTVYSPFCCKIIYDLVSGLLADPRIMGNYSNQDVMEICEPYTWLLGFDPTQEGLELDADYVNIHPHNLTTVIELDIYKYRFLQRVVAMFMNDRVELSGFIRLKELV